MGKELPVLKDLDAITAQTESGNRDYDDKGRPVTSPKGARFAMQVMPSTARDPGFGLKPANPNDPNDMNRLGREYRAVMERRYGGDYAKMWAAYNAGPGAVDSAIKRYGNDWLQHMPRETQDYVRRNQSKLGNKSMSNQTGNTSAPGQGIVDPARFLDGLQSSLAPESKASGAVTSASSATFGSDQELRTRAANAEQALVQQGQSIDVLTQVTDAAQAVQLQSLQSVVQESRAISEEITKGNEQLRRQVQPVFQARGRIADQLDKLNTMNPLERGLRSIFDLNYDRGFLKNQLDNYDRTLAMRANDFDYMTGLHERAMQEIDRRYGLDNALPGLIVEQAKEDLGIVGMRLQQTAGMLGSLRDSIAAESQLISAKALAREDMLARLDGPTVMDLATKAKGANGVVNYNGVEFSYHELRTRLENDEDQELNREAHRMAIANGRMDIAEKYATNLARSLTRQQAEAAIAADGVYNGVQLPQDVLQQVYSGHLATAQNQAQSIENSLPPKMALRTAADSLRMIAGIRERTMGMFGGKGIEGADTYVVNGTNLVRELIKATERGDPPEVITALTNRIAQNSAQMEKALDQSLLRQTGGDKTAAGYLKSFVYGAPMDSTASISAITHFAVRGSRPEGVAMTPETRKVFQFAEKKVREILDANPKISQQALEQQVSVAVSDYAGKSVGQARLERVIASVPALAARTGNPIGKLSESAWGQARANAAASAYQGVANELGITPDEVRRMRTSGKPLSNTPEHKELYRKFVGLASTFNALENQALIAEVDDLPTLQPGTRNSDHLIGFLTSKDFMGQTEAYERGTSQASFGDYLVNPIASGALQSMGNQTAEGLRVAQADRTQAERQQGRTIASGFHNNPLARANTILSTIPGVGKDGAAKLLPGIKQYIDANDASFWEKRDQFNRSQGYTGPAMEWTTTRMAREDQLILNYLQSTKFEDASLEAWRKAAVKGWGESTKQGYSLIESLTQSLGF